MDANDLIFMTSRYTIIAVQKSTGNQQWQRLLVDRFFKSSFPFITLLVDETGVYAHVDQELFRLDLDTGAILWRTKFKSDGSFLRQRIASLATLGVSAPPPSHAAAYVRADERHRTD